VPVVRKAKYTNVQREFKIPQKTGIRQDRC
jgi:hypothetical protein